MKKKVLLTSWIVFGFLLAALAAEAAGDRLLDDFFRDTRPEVEKISADPEQMKKFILAQKDVNARLAGGKTLLHYAAFRNDAGNVALLLQKGAAVNAADAHGRTPLHEAMSYFAFEAVSLLVENGADV
jgi:ankyrin repeat protein